MVPSGYKICPYCSETIKEEAIKCRYCHTLLQTPMANRFYRSKNGKIVAGVCQGLSLYFGIPVPLIRLMFILTTIIGGWGIFVYLAMCFLPAEPFSCAEATPRKEEKPTFSKRIWRLFNFLLFGVLFLCVYFPLGSFLLGAFFFFLWGMWVPIFQWDIFSFSFSDLGVAGKAGGAFACAILFYLFLLLVHGVLSLHFNRRFFKWKFFAHFVLFILLVSATISSLCMIVYKYRNVDQRTWTQRFADVQGPFPAVLKKAQAFDVGFPLRSVSWKSGQGNETIVSFTVKARGLDMARLSHFFDDMRVEWKGNVFFPKTHPMSSVFQFAEASLEIVVPEGRPLGLNVDCPVDLYVHGNYPSIRVESRKARFEFEKVHCDEFEMALSEGKAIFENATFGHTKWNITNAKVRTESIAFTGDARINLQNGSLECEETGAKLWDIRNHRGRVTMERCSGVFQIKDSRGKIALRSPLLENRTENSVQTDSGEIRVFPGERHRPILKISNRGKTVNKLFQYAPNLDAHLSLTSEDGEIWLEME